MAVHYHPQLKVASRPTPRTGTLTPPTLLLLALATACVAAASGASTALGSGVPHRPVTVSGDRTSPRTRRCATEHPRAVGAPAPPASSASSSQSLLPDPKTQCGQTSFTNRITHGQTADLGQFPWMSLLGFASIQGSKVTFDCGGTLINERYVLTAAHCFHDSDGTRRNLTLVRLGEYDRNATVDCDHNNVCAPAPQDIGVQEVIVHPEYSNSNKMHDIALVRLRRSVGNGGKYSDYIRPICLPLGLNVTDENRFSIAGWGQTALSGSGSPVLQFANVPGMKFAECALVLADKVTVGPGQLCAGGEKGRDACMGDSGGPLMTSQRQTWVDVNAEPDDDYLAQEDDQPQPKALAIVTYQIGVVSYGLGWTGKLCGGSGGSQATHDPSVYTRVSFYVPWIVSSLRP